MVSLDGINLCVFTRCKIVNSWTWTDGSLVLRCQVKDPIDRFSFITLVVKGGASKGLHLHKGQIIDVQRAQARSRDFPEAALATFKHVQLDGEPLNLEKALQEIGLSTEQVQGVKNLLKKATATRIMTEFVVDPNDLLIYD